MPVIWKISKAEIVYVSPVSAMSERLRNEVDYVITLEELVQWWKRRISITEKEPEQIAYRSREIAIMRMV